MSDRFPLIPKSRLPQPAHCVGCGSIERDCIDIGVQKDFWGSVLLCQLCFNDAQTSFPVPPDTELTILRRKVRFYEAKFGELRVLFNGELDRFFGAVQRFALAGIPADTSEGQESSAPRKSKASRKSSPIDDPTDGEPSTSGTPAFAGFFTAEQ